ncbi:MAG: MFS transporter [Pseudomonadota bacterium]
MLAHLVDFVSGHPVAETYSSRSQTVTIDEVVTTVIMARVTDFFGFFVYAIASALVFPRLFFPNFDPVTGTLLSFGVFSLAFLARPFASFAGRSIQRKIGRAGKITLALMIFGTSTMAIGMLPGYDSIGWIAPALLAALRIAQGLGLGGAWDGITMRLQNAAPEHRKGLYAMVPQLGGPIGFGVAASLFYVLTGFLTEEEFLQFGWRFAFFGVMAVNVVSLFARLRLLTADLGHDDEAILQSAPFLDLIRTQWRPILFSTMIPLASYALFHMVTVFPLGYTALFTDRPISQIILLQLFGSVLAIGSVMLSGILADRYSKRRVLLISTGAILLLCLTIQTLDTYPAIYILFGFFLLGLAYGQASSIVPNRYPPEYRYSGSALSTNLSWIVGAAFAPFVGLYLTVQFGLWASALYLLSGVVVTCVALYFLEQVKRATPS